MKPNVRQQEIQKKMEEAQVASNRFLAGLGLEMGRRQMAVQGRLLSLPTICYGKTADIAGRTNGNGPAQVDSIVCATWTFQLTY